ncbi:MAG TPA: SOS response-associated peptidase, partial [Caulobacteraceae bacterium]
LNGVCSSLHAMCNRFGYLAPVSRLVDEFSQTRLPLVFPSGAVPNLEPREHIRPTDTAQIIRAIDPNAPTGGVELADARWWLVPFFHKKPVKEWKPMTTNARSENVATTPAFREPFRRRHCLVPATHFFEWTGEKRAKTMWRFTKTGAEIFCFAGLWDRAHTADGTIESFTIITCAPGPDCAPYHNRQPVILERGEWAAWLDLTGDPTRLMQGRAAGTLSVERAIETVRGAAA